MTVVRHKFLRPSLEGDVPYSLELRFRPSRCRVLDGGPKAVVVPAEFTEDLPAGILNVDLAVTGPGWCWEIFRPYGKVESLREWVIVPEPVEDPDNLGEYLPVDYPDLVRVDPATLEPSAEPDPLWWAELEAAKATAADVEAARVAAAGSAVEAGASRDGAALAAGEASGSAAAAAGSALTASEQGALAATSADLASTDAVGAGAARTGAESARDATVAAAGGSEASAELAAGAAVESAQNALEAKQASDTIIEMTETGRLSEGALIDTIGELSGPVIAAQVAPVLDTANGAAQSAATSEAAALDVVTRADRGDFDGPQGLPGNATMRVDTTVGTRVFITDGVTERMISGDTSQRNVLDLMVNGWGVASNQNPMLRREDNTVTMRGYLTRGTDPRMMTLPAGFRPDSINVQGAFYSLATPALQVGVEISQYIRVLGNSTGTHYVYFRWSTSDAWPTTLPGIPA